MAAPPGQRAKDLPLRLARDGHNQATCRCCGEIWTPRVDAPKFCPFCHSPRWFRDTYAAGARAQQAKRRAYPVSIDVDSSGRMLPFLLPTGNH